jgi:hypothetical protein
LIANAFRPAFGGVVGKPVREKLDDRPTGAKRVDLAGEGELLLFQRVPPRPG